MPSTETERYNGFKGAPSTPNFSKLKASLNGTNAYNVYTTELSGGLDSSLSYSTFPTLSKTVISTATDATAVTLATYPSNSAAAATAQADAVSALETA